MNIIAINRDNIIPFKFLEFFINKIINIFINKYKILTKENVCCFSKVYPGIRFLTITEIDRYSLIKKPKFSLKVLDQKIAKKIKHNYFKPVYKIYCQ